MTLASPELVRAALSYIPAQERDTWLRMGMSIKSEYGDDGRPIWEEWSRTADNFKDKDAHSVWKSIKPDGGITLGTLLHEAQSRGFDFKGHNGYRRLTEPETQAKNKEREEREQREGAAAIQRRADAARRAKEIWESATPADSHPYLLAKGIKARDLRVGRWEQSQNRQDRWDEESLNNALLVRVLRRVDGRTELASLQAISSTGQKDFLAGGEISGGFFVIGDRTPRTLIAEGLATGISAHLATGCCTLVAFTANNLPKVAALVRETHPENEIVILADVDPDGLKYARKAAAAVNGKLALPGPADGPKIDFNDLHQCSGLEAVRRAVEAAAALEVEPVVPDPQDGQVRLLRASDMKPEPIRWLWEGWLAQGKFHLIAGAPGTGKTTLAMALAATVTIGGRWPDGTRSHQGSVLIWSGEDDPADTLLPRLLVCGADVSRVYFIGDVYADGNARPFNPARDMNVLRERAERLGDVRLIILDPVVNAVSGDSHKNSEVRRDLQPVADLAAKLGAAALGISHFSKGTSQRDPVERVTGSIAFGALPRVVMATAKKAEEDGTTTRLLVRAKSNIGPDGGGFSYDLKQSPVPGTDQHNSQVLWAGALAGEARDLLEVAEARDGERTATDEAVEWLRDVLFEGPVKAADVQKQARQAGIGDKALRTARERLGIKPVRRGFAGAGVWWWSIDALDAIDAHSKREGTYAGGGHLCSEDAPGVADANSEREVTLAVGGHLRDDSEAF